MKQKLGRSNIEISAMGFGAWAIGGEWIFDGRQAGWGKVDDTESIRAIHAALEGGINLIDTAANYGTGHSEEIIAQAIKDRRDQVVIATKFGFNVDEPNKRVKFYQSSEEIIKNLAFECERSLRHLHTDVIDVYQFHMWDFPTEYVPGVVEALEKLVKQGKIRSYGWSTDDVELAKLFASQENCTVIQHAANVLLPAPAMFSLTKQAKLVSLVRNPLMMGFLSEKYDANVTFSETDVRANGFDQDDISKIVANRAKVREILTSNGRSTVQGALAWLWANGEQVVPIPGIRTEDQAIENAAAMEFGPLTAAQMTEIDQILENKS